MADDYPLDHNQPPPPEAFGLSHSRPEACCPGFTLCHSRTRESAFLVDLSGKVVHRWQHRQQLPWQAVDMLPNGHLLAIPNWGRKHILELDWHSRLVWQDPSPAHHAVKRLPDGHTLAVCHGRAHYPDVCERPLLYDYLVELSREHHIAWEWHFARHVAELAAASLPPGGETRSDWPGVNAVEVLPPTSLGEEDSRFEAGNLLLSLRHANCLLVVDPMDGHVTWSWGPGEVLGPQQPSMMANGNVLLFDSGYGPPARGWSRVLEVEPATGAVAWEYRADPPTSFWSPMGGGAQRLFNHNTLISQVNWQQAGRVFEVTPAGEVVWEYWNPDGDMFGPVTRYVPEVAQPLLENRAPDGNWRVALFSSVERQLPGS